MVNKFFCVDCKKLTVCTWVRHIMKFDEQQKTFIPVEITLEACPEYDEVKDI